MPRWLADTQLSCTALAPEGLLPNRGRAWLSVATASAASDGLGPNVASTNHSEPAGCRFGVSCGISVLGGVDIIAGRSTAGSTRFTRSGHWPEVAPAQGPGSGWQVTGPQVASVVSSGQLENLAELASSGTHPEFRTKPGGSG